MDELELEGFLRVVATFSDFLGGVCENSVATARLSNTTQSLDVKIVKPESCNVFPIRA